MKDNLTHSMQFSDANLGFLPNSNTFRKGDKYASMVPGELVQPVTREGKPASLPLAVRAVHVMHLGDALDTYSMRNHAIRETNAARDAADDNHVGLDFLRAILGRHYVATDFTDDSLIVTVIEFGEGFIKPAEPRTVMATLTEDTVTPVLRQKPATEAE